MTDADTLTSADQSESPTTVEPQPQFDVPDDATTYDCAYCGRPFARESWLALHRGLAHPGVLDDSEIEAFRDAHGAEEEALATFRLKALGALGLIYFFLLMVYALV